MLDANPKSSERTIKDLTDLFFYVVHQFYRNFFFIEIKEKYFRSARKMSLMRLTLLL